MKSPSPGLAPLNNFLHTPPMLEIVNCIFKTQNKYFCVGGVGLMLPLNPVRPYYRVKQPKGKEGVCGLSQIADCNGYLTPRDPETAITHGNIHA